MALVFGGPLRASASPDAPAKGVIEVRVHNRSLHPVASDLFGQFLEKPSWGGETGSEAAVLPGTNRMDPQVVEMMRSMEIPLVRFPGGTSVDYLDWRDMVTDANGPGSGRPDSTGKKGENITNRFGYDEYFQLAEELGWKSILVVNFRDALLGDKDPAEAAEHAAGLLAYCAAEADAVPLSYRHWVELRKANGQEPPYPVEYVQLGNETYFWTDAVKEKFGDQWVKVWSDAIQTFMAKLREVKPDLKIITDAYPLDVAKELHERKAAVDVFAFHYYYPMGIKGVFDAKGKELDQHRVTEKQIWEAIAHGTWSDEEGMAAWQDEVFAVARERGSRLGMTEWNLNGWTTGSAADNLWPGFGACGLGTARMVHAMLRAGDVLDLATQSMLVGEAWGITGIRVGDDHEPFYFPQAETVSFYNKHHGEERLALDFETKLPMWDAEFFFDPQQFVTEKASKIDVVATRGDGKLFVHIVNSDFDQAYPVAISTEGFQVHGEAEVRQLQYLTKEEQPLKSAWTRFSEYTIPNVGETFRMTVPPRSAVVAVAEINEE